MSKKRRAKIPPFRVLNSENIFRKFVSKIMRSCDKNFAQLHQSVYKGDDVTDAEFEIQINEKGTYRLCVSGKDAKGHVIFSRCKEEKDIKNE